MMELINGGVSPGSNMDFFGLTKWLLGIFVIFMIVQTYWDFHTGKIYVMVYHRFKSKRIWILKNTLKVLAICVIYSAIMLLINMLVSELKITDLIRPTIMYALFVFNMNYIFCIFNLNSKVKVGGWVVLFGVSSVLCSTSPSRIYYNLSSYGMVLQGDVTFSLIANLIAAVALIVINMAIGKSHITIRK